MLLIFQSYQLVRNLRKGISVESQPEHQRVITQETDSLDMYYSTNPITNNATGMANFPILEIFSPIVGSKTPYLSSIILGSSAIPYLGCTANVTGILDSNPVINIPKLINTFLILLKTFI